MRSLPKTDVVIVGVGAAGGIAAHVLTKAGLKVVGLEAGPYLSNKDFVKHLDEIGGCFIRNSYGDPKFNKEIPTWRPHASAPLGEPALIWPMMNAVGGSSIHYGGQSWRYMPGNFRVRSETIKRYSESALPEGSTLVDWPIGYDELEPYYDQVEHTIGVSGRGGVNPFEGPRSRDYPMPPLRTAGYSKLAEQAMKALGLHPFPQPAAITSVIYQDRAACSYCGFCSGLGCWNDSKSSTLVTAIRMAEATGRFEVRPNSAVTRILVDKNGKVSGVQYRLPTGEIVEQPAGFVVLSSYTYENVRRLLLSRSERFPQGLANRHGQVGKHYISDIYSMVGGLFPDRKFNLFNGTVAQGVAIDDFNGDNFDHTGLGFIRGALIFACTQSMPIAASASTPPDVPRWGSAYKNWLKTNASSSGLMLSQLETLPYEGNFLDLDPEKTDSFGDPVVRVTYDLRDNEKRTGTYIAEQQAKILRAMGATKTWVVMPPIPVAVSTHSYGGARMGNDPTTSVVNGHSICHDVPNLAVLGGCTFPNTSAYAPTQTIQAISWRSAEHIAQNFSHLAA